MEGAEDNHDEHNEHDADPEQTLWSVVSVVVQIQQF